MNQPLIVVTSSKSVQIDSILTQSKSTQVLYYVLQSCFLTSKFLSHNQSFSRATLHGVKRCMQYFQNWTGLDCPIQPVNPEQEADPIQQWKS